MRRAILVCGGSVSAAFLTEVLKREKDAVLYAVDGGIRVFDEALAIPDYLIGDFDTADPALVERYESLCEVIRHNTEKDATDTELAVEEALRHGADHIILLGATGSRMDHTMANLHMLFLIMESGKTGEVRNETNRITLHRSSFTVKREELLGDYLSFLPFHGDVSKVTLTGVKYPLTDRYLPAGSSLCISNEATSEEIAVRFCDGILFMIEAKD